MGLRFFRRFVRFFFLFIWVAYLGLSVGCAATGLELDHLENPSPADPPVSIETPPSLSEPNAASPSSIPSGQPTQASQGIAHPTSSASNKRPAHSGAQEMAEESEDPQNREQSSQDIDIN